MSEEHIPFYIEPFESNATPFTSEVAEKCLRYHFAQHEELGTITHFNYHGYYLGDSGRYYHAFGVGMTGNAHGFDWYGAMVARESITLLNRTLYGDFMSKLKRLRSI